jgi:hypothetical protein
MLLLIAGLEMRSEAKSIHSDSRSRLADSELSAAALDRVARQAAALALPDESDGQPSPSHPAAAAAAAAAEGSAEGGKPPQVPKQLSRDITLSYPRGEGGSLPVEPASEGAAAAGRGGSLSPVDSLTFKPAGSSSSQAQPEAAAGPLGGHPALAPSAAGSDAATRGSVHQRNASVSSVGGTQRPVHYKSLSADSTRGGLVGPPGFARTYFLSGLPCQLLLGYSPTRLPGRPCTPPPACCSRQHAGARHPLAPHACRPAAAEPHGADHGLQAARV